MTKLEMVIVAISDDEELLEAFVAGIQAILNNPPKGIMIDQLESRYRFMEEIETKKH